MLIEYLKRKRNEIPQFHNYWPNILEKRRNCNIFNLLPELDKRK